MWEIYLLTVLYSVVLSVIGEIAATLRCKSYTMSADITHWMQVIFILCIPVFNVLLGLVVFIFGITLPKNVLEDLIDTYG